MSDANGPKGGSRRSPTGDDEANATLARLLDGLDELLRTREFEAIGVREILRASGCSASSFYALVGDKDGLLDRLHERWAAGVQESLADADVRLDSEADLDEMLHFMVRRLLAERRAGPGRSRASRRSRHPALVARKAALNGIIVEAFRQFIARRVPDQDARDVDFRARFGARVIGGAIWDICDYDDDLATGLELDDHQLAAALTELALRYLGAPPQGS